MKRESLKSILVVAVACVSPALVPIMAGTDCCQAKAQESKAEYVQKAIQGVPAPELAATASRLLTKATVEEKEAVALAAVQVIVSKHPAAARTIVASLSKAEPKLAAKIAARAAKLTPDQAAELAYVAALAARGEAQAIQTAIAQAVPTASPMVAARMNEAFPEMPDNLAGASTSTEEVAIERNARSSEGGVIIIQKSKKNPPQRSVSGEETPGGDYGRP